MRIHGLFALLLGMPALPASPAWGAPSWHSYVGARGQLDFSKARPVSSTNFWLTHRMTLESGTYRRITQENLAGIGVGGTIISRDDWYCENPFGEDHAFAKISVYDERCLPPHRNRIWLIPIHIELQFMRFPGGQIGKGRYYRAGLRTTRTYLIWQKNWKWRPYEAYASYSLGAGYGWKIGQDKNVRLEGQFILRGERVLQAAMSFGRWW